VWRWNIGGLGYSGSGYGGDYALALTPDGKINASRILSGELEGQYIKAGAITTDKLDSEAVTSAKIKAGAITADKLDTRALYVNGIPLAGNVIYDANGLTMIQYPYWVQVFVNAGGGAVSTDHIPEPRASSPGHFPLYGGSADITETLGPGGEVLYYGIMADGDGSFMYPTD
jgi:hypothetical protein